MKINKFTQDHAASWIDIRARTRKKNFFFQTKVLAMFYVIIYANIFRINFPFLYHYTGSWSSDFTSIK